MTAPSPMREAAREMRRQGLPLSRIAAACGVTKACVSIWCRDLPGNGAVTAANTAKAIANRKPYPPGTEKLAAKLRAAGVPETERLRIARQVAAEARA